MEKRRIGSLRVSVVGLGCNNFGRRVDPAGTASVLDAALDAGVDFLDTADIYTQGESEEFLGRAMRGRRERFVLATKFGMKVNEQMQGGGRPEYVRLAVEDSLRRLATDRIDLYQLHRPDPAVPVAETLGALDELVRAGKVREIGCSNFSVEQLREAEDASRASGGARFASVQNEYSLVQREPEGGVLEECLRQGVAFIPYFPLASGLLSGKYRQGQPLPAGRLGEERYAVLLSEENLGRVERLISFAAGRGHTLLELAFSWLLARPAVASVIAGATRPEQVHANAAAAGWKLSADDLAEVDRLLA